MVRDELSGRNDPLVLLLSVELNQLGVSVVALLKTRRPGNGYISEYDIPTADPAIHMGILNACKCLKVTHGRF